MVCYHRYSSKLDFPDRVIGRHISSQRRMYRLKIPLDIRRLRLETQKLLLINRTASITPNLHRKRMIFLSTQIGDNKIGRRYEM